MHIPKTAGTDGNSFISQLSGNNKSRMVLQVENKQWQVPGFFDAYDFFRPEKANQGNSVECRFKLVVNGNFSEISGFTSSDSGYFGFRFSPSGTPLYGWARPRGRWSAPLAQGKISRLTAQAPTGYTTQERGQRL